MSNVKELVGRLYEAIDTIYDKNLSDDEHLKARNDGIALAKLAGQAIQGTKLMINSRMNVGVGQLTSEYVSDVIG